jgi:cell division protein FtsW (lipid II flippase)
MVGMIQKSRLRDFDWLLAFLAIGIVCFGTIQIRHAQPTENYWVKQLIGLAIAVVAMLLVAFNDYRKLINIRFWSPTPGSRSHSGHWLED